MQTGALQQRVVVAPRVETAEVRELVAHAKELKLDSFDGVTSKRTDQLERAIAAAETAKGRAADVRVSHADMERAVTRSKRAAKIKPAAQKAMFGFTRLIDAKLSLTSESLAVLASTCDRDRLLQMINDGPGDKAIAWTSPKNEIELIASIVRQIVLGDGASKQLTVEVQTIADIAKQLGDNGHDVRLAMGGAGAFAANLAAALGIDARFFAGEPIPPAIADRFARNVRVLTKEGELKKPGAHPTDAPARTNLAIEYQEDQPLALFGMTSLMVNGEEQALSPGGTGRVIVGSKAKDVRPGFSGVDDDTLKQMGGEHDVFFFVGAHYLTSAPTPEDARLEAAELGRDLDVMKDANPSLIRHAQYVSPKVGENEAIVWGALKGHIDSLALNAVEVAPFVDALHDGGLTRYDIDPNIPREAAEDTQHMLEGALGLADALDLKRVHVHGLEGDIVVSAPGMPGANDPDRQLLALMRARMIAANKAANESGEIKEPEDMFDVVPSVRGTGLAALHRFADAMQTRFGLTDLQRDLIVERWYFKDDSGRTIHFVPSRGIHDRSGGTVSLGDTIDAAGLLFAVKPQPNVKIPHGSSYSTA